jgi:PKHD-type hydroxylase
MSKYQFEPSPNFGRSEHPFATWENGFTADDIQKVITAGGLRTQTEATLDTGYTESVIRTSQTSWLDLAEDTAWLYERLSFIARQLNGQFFGFDLFGFNEHMQFTVYQEGGHYTWHQDSGVSDTAPRKLSMVVQLTDPSEYEGGDLQILSGPNETTVSKQLGQVTAFPSYMLHRVTPVTKGVRRTLVVWVTGPSFK